jgi:hypothetical protein
MEPGSDDEPAGDAPAGQGHTRADEQRQDRATTVATGAAVGEGVEDRGRDGQRLRRVEAAEGSNCEDGANAFATGVRR